jgi:hypothetical protein
LCSSPRVLPRSGRHATWAWSTTPPGCRRRGTGRRSRGSSATVTPRPHHVLPQVRLHELRRVRGVALP